ncbi:MAG: hypothetical protein KF745_14680 [Phycisphaeraceae bacterium]|nr:hypothetical protein [Phycisphaeraceae bacterium]
MRRLAVSARTWGEVGEAKEECGGAAGGFAGAAAEFQAALVAGADGEVGFVGVVLVDGAAQGDGGRGEEVGGDDAGAAGDGGLDVVQALRDLGLGEPEDEGFDRGVVEVGDVAEGEGGVGDGIEDLGREVGGGVEGGEVEHDPCRIRVFDGMSIGF